MKITTPIKQLTVHRRIRMDLFALAAALAVSMTGCATSQEQWMAAAAALNAGIQNNQAAQAQIRSSYLASQRVAVPSYPTRTDCNPTVLGGSGAVPYTCTTR